MDWIPWVVTAAIACRLAAQLVLSVLDAGEVRRNRGAVPEAFRGVMSDEAYRRAGDYSLAKGRFARVEHVWDAVLLGVVLFSGLLPAAWAGWTALAGEAAWSGALFVVGAMLALSIPSLPLDWWAQFRLEARFGFNRTTPRLWIADHLKGVVLSLLLGWPLGWLLLELVSWVGAWWWLAAWAVFMGFQLFVIVLYPMVILPWFNKLAPLPPGSLADRLAALADRARFRASKLQVMDGSKRSAHSNAFFTGFGRFRRIVLYDTLIGQLSEAELEAVLAHEIGHYKLGHVPRMLALSAALSLGAFWAIGRLAGSPAFFGAFGFPAPAVAVAFLLVALLGGLAAFWAAPAMNRLSRKHEYEADAFARRLVGGPEPLVAALRKLAEKNLANLTPHPLFSGFHYSHPTLGERERALRAAGR
jgi:STE24 endopeptidase